MTILQIANDIRERSIEEYVKNGSLNIADIIYDYIEENREALENNCEFPMEDDDIFAEEIAINLDEDDIVAEAMVIRNSRAM